MKIIAILVEYLIAYNVVDGISARNVSKDTLFLQVGIVFHVLITVMDVIISLLVRNASQDIIFPRKLESVFLVLKIVWTVKMMNSADNVMSDISLNLQENVLGALRIAIHVLMKNPAQNANLDNILLMEFASPVKSPNVLPVKVNTNAHYVNQEQL